MKLKSKTHLAILSPISDIVPLVKQRSEHGNPRKEQLETYIQIIYETYAKVLTRAYHNESLKRVEVEDNEIDELVIAAVDYNIVGTTGIAHELTDEILKYFKKAQNKDLKFLQRTIYLSNKVKTKIWNYTPLAVYKVAVLVLETSADE